jgi:hypothetical protein
MKNPRAPSNRKFDNYRRRRAGAVRKCRERRRGAGTAEGRVSTNNLVEAMRIPAWVRKRLKMRGERDQRAAKYGFKRR